MSDPLPGRKAIGFLIALDANIEVFHFFTGPGSFPQKGKARFYAGIKLETPDVDDTAQVFPTEMFNKFSDNHFERFSVKGIF
jgi:hypothetical protein